MNEDTNKVVKEKELDKDLEQLSEASQDSKAAQKVMLDKAKKHAEDPMAMAANTFGMLLPRFNSLLSQLKVKQRDRLMQALIQYPLNEFEFDHRGPVEVEAFKIGNRLLEAKYTMIFDTYFNKVILDQQKVEEYNNKQKESKDDREEEKTTD